MVRSGTGAGSRQGARPESEPGTRAGHGESPGARGWQGARLRAAVDRLHAAQLAALAARGATAAPSVSAFAPPAPPEEAPASRRDAHAAQREALAQVDEMGSLLVRLARPGRANGADGDVVAIRRRLVKLAAAAAITLAELVGLAFEIESPDALIGRDQDAAAPARPGTL